MARVGGRLVCCFELRRRVAVRRSDDDGRTWGPPTDVAGSKLGDGCYEPAAVRLPGGQVHLFFANEHGHAEHTQEIDRMVSDDAGRDAGRKP